MREFRYKVQDATLFVDRTDIVLKQQHKLVYTEQILNYLVKSAESQQFMTFSKNHAKRRKSRLPWFSIVPKHADTYRPATVYKMAVVQRTATPAHLSRHLQPRDCVQDGGGPAHCNASPSQPTLTAPRLCTRWRWSNASPSQPTLTALRLYGIYGRRTLISSAVSTFHQNWPCQTWFPLLSSCRLPSGTHFLEQYSIVWYSRV